MPIRTPSVPTAAAARADESAPASDAVHPRTIRLEGKDLAARMDHEWVLTNGLGGFAMGTVSAVPDRKYHAWLVGATLPPVGRMVALHSVAEWLVVESMAASGCVGLTRIPLAAYRFGGGFVGPDSRGSLVRFEKGTTCRWTYRPKQLDVEVERELFVHHGLNACSVRYRVHGLTRRAFLELRPMVGLRDFHGLVSRAEQKTAYGAILGDRSMKVAAHGHTLSIECDGPTAKIVDQPEWWNDFSYHLEADRGQPDREDLWSPGYLMLEAGEDSKASREGIVLTAWMGEARPSVGMDDAVARERARVGVFAAAAVARATEGDAAAAKGADDERELAAIGALAIAADQFIVRRELGKEAAAKKAGKGEATVMSSVIAGYPWFSDWGRDTAISLPGLFIATGRYTEARDSLRAFAAYRRNGLVPNCFDNGAGTPEYNTVDASLWFIHAACQYLRATGDHDGFCGDIRAACIDIVDAYRRGTDFGIGADPADGLIRAGDEGTQLTWMDAKRDGVVFTPRHGKPVEISALWYSALLELAGVLHDEQPILAGELRTVAHRVGESFVKRFWNAQRGCLFDVLTPRKAGGEGSADGSVTFEPVADIRPNQVFAVSVPHSPLSQQQREAVLKVAKEKLWTPVGMRTLAADDPKYKPRFEGPLFERDGAYHNGTVWPWLIGAYAEGVLRVGGFSREAIDEADRATAPLVRVFMDGQMSRSIDQLAEVYDAEEPRRPDGCMAQAWSIAELLRARLMIRRAKVWLATGKGRPDL